MADPAPTTDVVLTIAYALPSTIKPTLGPWEPGPIKRPPSGTCRWIFDLDDTRAAALDADRDALLRRRLTQE